MVSRRELMQAGLAASALLAGSGLGAGRAFAQQKLTQADILRFEPLGNVTLMHVADIHAQLVPTYFREPAMNLGVGEAKGRVPHITGKDFLDLYKIPAGSPMAYALTSRISRRLRRITAGWAGLIAWQR